MPLFPPSASSSSGPGFRLVARWQEPRTFTNIGTSFVDVYNVGLNNQRQLVDFTGSTQYRIVYHYQAIGTGTHSIQVVDQATNANVLDTRSDAGGGRPASPGWRSR
jgi:hypothetical protein